MWSGLIRSWETMRNQRRAFATPKTQDWKDEKEWKASKWEQWKPKASSSKSQMLRFGLFVLVCFSVLKSSIWKNTHCRILVHKLLLEKIRSVSFELNIFLRDTAQVRMIHGLQMIHGLRGRNQNGRKNNKTKRRLAIQDLQGFGRYIIYCILLALRVAGPVMSKMSLPGFLCHYICSMVNWCNQWQPKQFVSRCCRGNSDSFNSFRIFQRQSPRANQRLFSSKLKCNWNTLHFYGGFEHTDFCCMNRYCLEGKCSPALGWFMISMKVS